MRSSTRILTGLTAATLILIGGGLMIVTDRIATGGVLLRAGAVLAAVWVAMPLWRRPTSATVASLVGIALVVIRPKLILPICIAAVIWRLSTSDRRPRPRPRRLPNAERPAAEESL